MKKHEHREEKWVFPFVEYLPEKADGKLPLIIQLHGADERGEGKEDLALVEIHGFSKLLKDVDYPCRIVMPQCPWDSFWVAKTEAVLRFIDQLTEEFDVDEDRICLSGLSMGGYGTWYIAMAQPNRFAAIAPVCGGGMAWNAPVLKMPIWVFHGACDSVVSPFHSDEMVKELKKVGADVTYSRVENVDHDVWKFAYGKDLLEWLLRQRKG